MRPDVYLYDETDRGCELYLGEYSLIKGLSLFDESSQVEVLKLGATCYRNYGWATEKDIPKFETLGSFISFLKSEDDIGIIELEVELPGIGFFCTHDAGCHFIINTRHKCVAILKCVTPAIYSGKLINELIQNMGLYLTCSDTGEIKKYSSFDEYLDKES